MNYYSFLMAGCLPNEEKRQVSFLGVQGALNDYGAGWSGTVKIKRYVFLKFEHSGGKLSATNLNISKLDSGNY